MNLFHLPFLNKLRLLAFSISILVFVALNAQQTQTKFGKNRVQYKGYEWSYYNTDKLDIYFYLGGQEIGKFIIREGENEINWVEQRLNYRMDKKVQVLVFNDLNDVYQTNLGLEEESYNTGGQTKILGNKAFIYFNGDHGHLLNQLRKSLISIYINDMMYGGDIRDVVQNAVLMNLPDWFYSGLMEYYTLSWRAEDNERLKDGILSKKYRNFMRLSSLDPVFAGQSMWHFIEKKYGSEAVKNILYFARINRSVESGFLFVLGLTIKETYKQWHQFYMNNYLLSNGKKEKLDLEKLARKKFKKHKKQYGFKLGPYGRKVAYIENELGRYKVKILDLESSRQKTILRGGFKSLDRVLDRSFPLLDWAEDGSFLSVLYEHKDETYLMDYYPKDKNKEQVEIEKFQKVLSFEYMGNNQNILFSAVNRGQVDLYTMYKPTQRLKRLTNDPFDDLEPTFVKGEDFKGILYVSNRNNDTLDLPKGYEYDSRSYDLYYYDLLKKWKTLARITETPDVREKSPMAYNQTHFSFLSDKGLLSHNRHISKLDSVFSRYDTLVLYNDSLHVNPGIPEDVLAQSPNDSIKSWELKMVHRRIGRNTCIGNLERGVREQDRASRSNKLLNVVRYKKRNRVIVDKVIGKVSRDMAKKITPSFLSRSKKGKLTTDLIYADTKEPLVPDSLSYGFIPDYLYKDINETEELPSDSVLSNADPLSAIQRLQKSLENKDFRQSSILPYYVKMTTDYVVSQLDNSFMFTPYEHFTGGPVMSMTSLNPLVKVGTQDLFEDFKLVGGFRFPTNLSGSEYFLSFDNLKQRLDKKLVLYRKSDLNVYDFSPYWYLPVTSKVKTNYVEGTLSWPFSELSRLQCSGAFRNMRYYFQATDTFSLNRSPYNENWSLIRLEYVFDNTIPLGLNVYDGIRFKFYTEYQQSLTEKESNIYVIGGDIRAYKKLYRNFIFAQRLSFAKSMGSRNIIYYLGGVDGWVVPKFDYTTPISQTQNYAFQALATNMRGFVQNVRNGNTNVVYNAEFRLPIVKFLNLQFSSEFLQQLQVIGFSDIGTAWVGKSPYSDENPLNTEDFVQGPISVNVHYVRDPIVRSLGYGLRSKLFGYFARIDYAWGYEDGTWLDPAFYLSMSLDF